MFDITKEYALVLSGGGSRGAYEIGVWEALRELGVKISAVSGTSIGAVNGAFIVQDDFYNAYNVWKTLSPDILFDSAKGSLLKYRDTDKMAKLLNAYIDEQKIRASDIDFALVTLNVSDFTSLVLFKEDIPSGQLPLFVLASANHPAFKRLSIEGDKYMDGGLYNNMPIQPLIDKGYKNIIVVDIRDIYGITDNKYNAEDCEIIYVKSRHKFKNVLDFSNDEINRNIKKGYYDIYMLYGKYISSYYYILKSDSYERYYLNDEDFNCIKNDPVCLSLSNDDNANKYVLEYLCSFRKKSEPMSIRSKEFFITALEICANVLGVEDVREYTLKEFCDIVIKDAVDILYKGKYLDEIIKNRVYDKFKSMNFKIEQEDKRVVLAALLRFAGKFSYFSDLYVVLSPKIIISYFVIKILINKFKV